MADIGLRVVRRHCSARCAIKSLHAGDGWHACLFWCCCASIQLSSVNPP